MNTEPTSRKLPLLALAGAFALSGISCQNPYLGYPPPPGGNVFMSRPPEPQQPQGPQNRFGHNGTQSPNRKPTGEKIRRDPDDTEVSLEPPPPRKPRTDEPVETPKTEDPPPSRPSTTDNGASSPVSNPSSGAAKPAPKEDLPFGSKVIGKPGMVYSPYAPDKGWVDVDGLRPGTKVKCPYTGKNFRVP